MGKLFNTLTFNYNFEIHINHVHIKVTYLKRTLSSWVGKLSHSPIFLQMSCSLCLISESRAIQDSFLGNVR